MGEEPVGISVCTTVQISWIQPDRATQPCGYVVAKTPQVFRSHKHPDLLQGPHKDGAEKHPSCRGEHEPRPEPPTGGRVQLNTGVCSG